MPAPKAPLLDASGAKTKDITLTEAVFAAEVRPHLVHEAVRAEAASARAGTHSAKSRGQVAGGRSKPWRQKGTGRARAGTSRASQWTGGGVAFPPTPRDHSLKVNRKVRKAALRSSLSDHVSRGTLALLEDQQFTEPSTKSAAALLESWGGEEPVLVVADIDDDALYKSFRNLPRALVLEPAELEVGAVVWARSLLVSESALEKIEGAAT